MKIHQSVLDKNLRNYNENYTRQEYQSLINEIRRIVDAIKFNSPDEDLDFVEAFADAIIETHYAREATARVAEQERQEQLPSLHICLNAMKPKQYVR